MGSQSNASNTTNTSFHAPFPQEFTSECEKAKNILAEFSQSFASPTNEYGFSIPPQAFLKAKGIVVFSVFKVGAGWSGRIGSGVVIAKLPNGRWSAPSAVALFGIGYGFQFGASITDFVYLLTSDSSMNSFLKKGQLTLGAQFAITAGSTSTEMEASTIITPSQSPSTPGHCFAKSKGMFVGVSIEGALIRTRRKTNARFYKHSITQGEILLSQIPSFESDQLYLVLEEIRRNAINKIQKDAEDVLLNSNSYSSQSQDINKVSTAPHIPSVGQDIQKVDLPRYTAVSENSENELVPHESNTFESVAIAIFDFDSEHPGELSFKKGDVIYIVSRTESNDAWWVGKLNGVEGKFPANRTRIEI